MNDAVSMRGSESRSDFRAVAQREIQWKRPFLKNLPQSLAFDELHHQVAEAVLLPDIVETANVGVVER